MSTCHIAFISFPHTGHVNPTLPIVSTLVRRGIRVTYVTSEPYLARVALLGAEGVACRGFSHVKRSEIPPVEADLYETSVCKLASKTLPLIREFYRRDVPDLIVYDILAISGKILAEELHVPAIKTSPFPAFERNSFALQMRNARLREWATNYSALGENFLAMHGIESRSYIFHREPLNVQLIPLELDVASHSLDPSCVYAGRCPAEQTGFGNWTPSQNITKPIVLLAASTTRKSDVEYFRTRIEALRVLNVHVVMSMRNDFDVTALGTLPDVFEIVRDTSHIKILPFCDAVIYMGGSITAAEAAYHGVPLVMTPQGDMENTGYSDHLGLMGVGVHVRHCDFDQPALRRGVHLAMTDSRIKRAVNQWQSSVRRQPSSAGSLHLCLQNIDWQSGLLTIRGKGRQRVQMPLPNEVGVAIGDYLQHGRPRSESRRVFLREWAPHIDFASAASVTMIARAALGRLADSDRAGSTTSLARQHTDLCQGRCRGIARVPMTHCGKFSEKAVRDLLNGKPLSNRSAVKNPESLTLLLLRILVPRHRKSFGAQACLNPHSSTRCHSL